MSKTTTGIFFDKRGMREGYFMVKWLVYHQGKSRNYTTGLEITTSEAEFLKANKKGLPARIKNDKHIALWNRIFGAEYIDPKSGESVPGLLARAQAVIDRLENSFSFEQFAQRVTSPAGYEAKKLYPSDALSAMTQRSIEFDREGRAGTARTIRTAAQSFRRFAIAKGFTNSNDPKLPFSVITPEFLVAYEKWMLKEGKYAQPMKDRQGKVIIRKGTPASISTVGAHGRSLQAVFNEAIEAGVVRHQDYPFKKYKLPKPLNKKKALPSKLIAEIFYFKCPPGSKMEYRRDLWVFSYLCNGMNFSDILHLKWKHVDPKGMTIKFVRQKTKRTKRDNALEIIVRLNPTTLRILEQWGTKDRRPENFVFAFLNDQMDAKTVRYITDNVIDVNNDWMKKIVLQLGYDPKHVNVNTYSARHSFATTLVRSKTPLAFISQSLGHSSLLSTEKYIGSFEDEQVNEYLGALIPEPIKQEGQDL